MLELYIYNEIATFDAQEILNNLNRTLTVLNQISTFEL